ncbi:hypothetical protein [Oceaniglobus trochenteri]|uniref:hypothetical protein n=1 Tax=Oceaniglobus trochenteri TaxID=2763260 RepID=UPI001CFF9800|nr:hypothetical protein [Oceaniglobus trochenteri]
MFGLWGATDRAIERAQHRARAMVDKLDRLERQVEVLTRERDEARSALAPFADFAPCFCNCNRHALFVGVVSSKRFSLSRADFDVAYQAAGRDLDKLNARRDEKCRRHGS